jgi:hypothetical protein
MPPTGVYSFYVDARDGRPVAFHAKGHNVVVGGSHTDDYWLGAYPCLSLSIYPSIFLSFSVFLYLPLFLSLSLSVSLSLSHTHTHTLYHSITLSVSFTHLYSN